MTYVQLATKRDAVLARNTLSGSIVCLSQVEVLSKWVICGIETWLEEN